MDASTMTEIHNAIDALRRENRHDLREVRVTLQQLTELITEGTKGVIKVEGQMAVMEQKCVSMENRMNVLKTEVDILDTDVSKLKAERNRLVGSWHTVTIIAAGVSAGSVFGLKWVGG